MKHRNIKYSIDFDYFELILNFTGRALVQTQNVYFETHSPNLVVHFFLSSLRELKTKSLVNNCGKIVKLYNDEYIEQLVEYFLHKMIPNLNLKIRKVQLMLYHFLNKKCTKT